MKKARSILTITFGIVCLLFPASAHAEVWRVDDLHAARQLDLTRLDKTADAKLLAMADALRQWQKNALSSGVSATTEQYIKALKKSRVMYGYLRNKDPQVQYFWKDLESAYYLGEMLPEGDKRRESLFEEMETLADTCIKSYPEAVGCWLYRGIALGRGSTTRGLLQSAFAAKHVEKAFLKTLELAQSGKTKLDSEFLDAARYALASFYRIVPDSWVVKALTGSRGNIDKSIALLRLAVASEPFWIEIEKELAVSLLCKAKRDKDAKAKTEGIEILKDIVHGKFDASSPRITDVVDKDHARMLIKNPGVACGYSRDGIQDTGGY